MYDVRCKRADGCRLSCFYQELNELENYMENGIIIDGHTYELIDDSSITRCDDCVLLDKCVEFWAMAEEENPKLCTFLYGEKANNKRFTNQTN